MFALSVFSELRDRPPRFLPRTLNYRLSHAFRRRRPSHSASSLHENDASASSASPAAAIANDGVGAPSVLFSQAMATKPSSNLAPRYVHAALHGLTLPPGAVAVVSLLWESPPGAGMFQVITAPQVLRGSIAEVGEDETSSKEPLTAVFPAAPLPPASLVQNEVRKALPRSPKKGSVGTSTTSAAACSASTTKAAGSAPMGQLWCSVQVYEVGEAPLPTIGSTTGDSAAAESACQTKAVRDSLLQQLPSSLPAAALSFSSFAAAAAAGSAVTSSVSTATSSSSSFSSSSSSTAASSASLLHREDLSGGLPIACAGLPKRGSSCRSADVAELVRAVGAPSATSLVPIRHPLFEAPGQIGSSKSSSSSSHHSAHKSRNSASNTSNKEGPREWTPLLLAPPLGTVTGTAVPTTVSPQGTLVSTTVRLVVRLALAPPLPCRLGEACLGAALLSHHRYKEQSRTKQKNPPSHREEQQELQQELVSPPKEELRLNGTRSVAHEYSSHLSDHFHVAPGPPVALVLFHLTYQAKLGSGTSSNGGNGAAYGNGDNSSHNGNSSHRKSSSSTNTVAEVADNTFVQVEARRSLTCPFCAPARLSNASGNRSSNSHCAPEPSPEALLQHMWSHHGEYLEFTSRRDRRDVRVFHVAVQRKYGSSSSIFDGSAEAVAEAASCSKAKKGAKGRKEVTAVSSAKKIAEMAPNHRLTVEETGAPASYQLWSPRGLIRRAKRAQRILQSSQAATANAAGGPSDLLTAVNRGKKRDKASNEKEKRSVVAAASNGPNKRSKKDSSGYGENTTGSIFSTTTTASLKPATAEAAADAVSAAAARLCQGSVAATAQRGKGAAQLPVRQYYHSRTGVPMLPHEMDDDSDGDIDDDWAVINYDE